MLKLNDKEKTDLTYNASYDVTFKDYSITVHYEKNDEDDAKILEKRIEELTNSIARREKLLSNENYVNKAPQNIVEDEKKKLAEEKSELEKLKK